MKPRYLMNDLLARWGYTLEKASPFRARHRRQVLAPTFDMLVGLVTLKKPNPYFVVVGAFDGRAEDFLYEHIQQRGWKGMLIEPQKEAFELLKKNFAGRDDLTFLNLAIGEENGTATLYRPLEGKDVSTMASLSRDQLQPLLDSPEHQGKITVDEYEVTVKRLESVCEEQQVESVDILQIDTEGLDDKVIYSANLARYQPLLIQYENIHLPSDREEKLWDHLVGLGYRLHVQRFNTLALHESVAD